MHPGAVVLFFAVGWPFKGSIFDEFEDQIFAVAQWLGSVTAALALDKMATL